MIVEYLIADEDGTWRTIMVDVPPEVPREREALVQYAERELSQLTEYRRIALWALYNEDPEEKI